MEKGGELNMANAECLKQRIGSCGGCPVLEIVESKISLKNGDKNVIQDIAQVYCPKGEVPTLPEMTKKSIW